MIEIAAETAMMIQIAVSRCEFKSPLVGLENLLALWASKLPTKWPESNLYTVHLDGL